MDREKCQSCGNPVWLCHSSSNLIEFEVKIGTCYGREAVEVYEKDESKPKLTPGQFLYSKPIGLENEDGTFEPLPSRIEALQQIG